jgi:hypothetical protein
MGDIFNHFQGILDMMNGVDEPVAPKPSNAGPDSERSPETSPGQTQGPTRVGSNVNKETQAHARLSELCRLCLDATFPDFAEAALFRTRKYFYDIFVSNFFSIRTQSHIRGFLQRQKFSIARRAVLTIQQWWRFRKHLKRLRRAAILRRKKTRAATLFQAVWRGHRVRKVVAFIRGARDLELQEQAELEIHGKTRITFILVKITNFAIQSLIFENI